MGFALNYRKNRTYMIYGKNEKTVYPITVIDGFVDAELIGDLPLRTQQDIFEWIKNSCVAVKTPADRTSYGIKHVLQRDTGIYITNNQFKHAMLLSGYKPVKEDEINWTFRLSRKCHAIKGLGD